MKRTILITVLRIAKITLTKIGRGYRKILLKMAIIHRMILRIITIPKMLKCKAKLKILRDNSGLQQRSVINRTFLRFLNS